MATELPAVILRSAREIGEDVAGWRKILGLTAEQVADRADISRDTLRKLEHGDSTVSFHVVLRVARALGVLEKLTEALDPLTTDLGRARASMLDRQRVR
ncbi:helix-turn-helix domain-containing protein [Paramicrobacterium agarici]|uniref:DNA-binding XRE family transcriptional regulator n=1 Tax=Paramicrobacterium agarici TaxID=630514 RepID=A0A2A9E161_9MICO|nr:helix-turn-helix transcriptional regulator [Microbacterium agarici]PFG31910.1 DNA-binding XRE family transcriptional regulator [Microbacterium agarici]